MRVVFLEDVAGVAQGGDIKEVKNGFARNYLLPKNLAVAATHNALQRIEGLKKQGEVSRLRSLSDMKELAEQLTGTQVNIAMRAGGNGRLYGSVTNAMVAEGLGEMIDREIDRRTVHMGEAIRALGIFDVPIQLHQDVRADIKVLVYAEGTDPEDWVEPEEVEDEDVEDEDTEEEATDEVEDDEPVAEAEAEEPVAELEHSEEEEAADEPEADEEESEEAEEEESSDEASEEDEEENS